MERRTKQRKKKVLPFSKWAEGYFTRNKRRFEKDLFIDSSDFRHKKEWLIRFTFINNPGRNDYIKMIAIKEGSRKPVIRKFPIVYDKKKFLIYQLKNTNDLKELKQYERIIDKKLREIRIKNRSRHL